MISFESFAFLCRSLSRPVPSIWSFVSRSEDDNSYAIRNLVKQCYALNSRDRFCDTRRRLLPLALSVLNSALILEERKEEGEQRIRRVHDRHTCRGEEGCYLRHAGHVQSKVRGSCVVRMVGETGLF